METRIPQTSYATGTSFTAEVYEKMTNMLEKKKVVTT